MKKAELSKIIGNIKKEQLGKPKTASPFNPVITGDKRVQAIRDMRQEAIDIGSHQAKEIFGESGEPSNR